MARAGPDRARRQVQAKSWVCALFERAVGTQKDRRDHHPRTDGPDLAGSPDASIGTAGRLIRHSCGRSAGPGRQFDAFDRADFRIPGPANARVSRRDWRDDSGKQRQQGKDHAVHCRPI